MRKLQMVTLLASLSQPRSAEEIGLTTGYLGRMGARQSRTEMGKQKNLDEMCEEILLAARAWTNGYDVFTPNENIALHYYTRENKPKFWEHSRNFTDAPAVEKVKYILGLQSTQPNMPENWKKNMSKFGLGKVRTLDSFWKFAATDFPFSAFERRFGAVAMVPENKTPQDDVDIKPQPIDNTPPYIKGCAKKVVVDEDDKNEVSPFFCAIILIIVIALLWHLCSHLYSSNPSNTIAALSRVSIREIDDSTKPAISPSFCFFV
ncbi:hypothetical protein M427DRAFT_50230 [Gonapodya prolifera JEL478]|uniref:Uncharacterized protein n=1 Tax=Gonapodya prolifera (strain JEL478) TaxID=1344416 RepID=A0A138ZWL6_GONPJ|nr:hypothetical protein M427DRAFT_50230 [Gonapodya prolifera JEL478]|eukprot:KXS08892.1 hypothetical protein M427DRAFT_50230 [Gonapodya prolifera JEL478]